MCCVLRRRPTPIRIRASALASSVCGRWRFISSPSKSALYGVHTHSLKRNVRWGLTLACVFDKKMDKPRKIKHISFCVWNNSLQRFNVWSEVARSRLRVMEYEFIIAKLSVLETTRSFSRFLFNYLIYKMYWIHLTEGNVTFVLFLGDEKQSEVEHVLCAPWCWACAGTAADWRAQCRRRSGASPPGLLTSAPGQSSHDFHTLGTWMDVRQWVGVSGGTTSEPSCFETSRRSRFLPFDLRETGLDEIGSWVNVRTVTHKFPH